MNCGTSAQPYEDLASNWSTVQQLFVLTGSRALITAGSRGLGLQLAHALGEAGATVVISSRKGADLESAAAQLHAAGIAASWIAADCADEDDNHPPGRRSRGATRHH